MQDQDIKDNCVGPAPYYIPHFKVALENRKGWQHAKGYDGPRTGEVTQTVAAHCTDFGYRQYLPKWRAYLQKLQPNRKVEADDYIFPYIAPNGLIHPKRDMSYDLLQGLLTKFAAAAGLQKHYTTHCFRRGGAQYRFMFAPVGKRWPLSWIRWWGGWAIGEHVSLHAFRSESRASRQGTATSCTRFPLVQTRALWENILQCNLHQASRCNRSLPCPASTKHSRSVDFVHRT